jgi:23S rRNA (guanosine2251-2'-O)-methyltransferase
MRTIILIAHNLRSCHNVGSLLRTAEGLGVATVILSGYTPYPEAPGDIRLPHIRRKLHAQIQKTALGAEQSQVWRHYEDITAAFTELRHDGYTIAALEQTPRAVPLPDYAPPEKLAIVIGREVEGIEQQILDACDIFLVIPMFGKKESFNVVQATAMALFHCRFSQAKL